MPNVPSQGAVVRYQSGLAKVVHYRVTDFGARLVMLEAVTRIHPGPGFHPDKGRHPGDQWTDTWPMREANRGRTPKK